MLLDGALDHCEGIAQESRVYSVPDVNVFLLFLALRVNDGCADVEEEEELPKGKIAEDLLLPDFLQNSAFLGVEVVGTVVRVAVEDDLMYALKVNRLNRYFEDLLKDVHQKFETLHFKFEVASLSEGFDVLAEFSSISGIVFSNLLQHFLGVFLFSQLFLEQGKASRIARIFLFCRQDFLLLNDSKLKLIVGIGKDKLQLLIGP